MAVETRYIGKEIRTTDAIERTSIVVLGTLVEAGTVSPGPPGAHRVDEARVRVEQVLTPGAGARVRPGTFTLSYNRQVWPESAAETALEQGTRYVLFCAEKPGRRLHALKIVPHSDEAVRVVASAFGGGTRHAAERPPKRLA